ncbi:MAG: quinolinate synthase NadA [Bacteroidetes bacterium]|nr:quinolinate synthase NadA [Bacteroidota bacterium]
MVNEPLIQSDLAQKINLLKKEMNAVILAHYYQDGEIQDIADFVGDSLQLAQAAVKTQADVIVFAGVHFMAETAKILNPDKLVLLPDLNAGCSLADDCPYDDFKAFRGKYPDHKVLSYINCSAAIKTLSDVIVTSSNAEKIVRSFPENQPLIFAPDKNLGAYLNKKLGKNMILWDGSCQVHEVFSERKMIDLKLRHPEALILAHPECTESILNHADYIGSTTGILNYAVSSPAKEFIVVTEPGIIHQMGKACPDKVFIPAPPEANCACNECPHMKLNTMEKIYLAMKNKFPEIILDAETLRLARLPIDKMLALS